MVSRRILKVTVLHELGIESAIRRITDILEEHAHELVGDLLHFRLVNRQRGMNPMTQSGEARSVVFHPLRITLALVGQRLEIVGDIVEMHLGHLKLVTGISLSRHRRRVHDPGIVTDRAGRLVFREMPEVLVGFDIAPSAVLCLKIDIEGAIVHLEHHGRQSAMLAHPRIILRAPCHEVLTVSRCKARSRAVHREQQPPRAVGGVDDIRRVHLLLRAPRTIVGSAELADILPLLLVCEISDMQSLRSAGTINEYLARSIFSRHFVGGMRLRADRQYADLHGKSDD